MYSLNVRDHFMIAHSLRGETFGPAQGLHGATYVVDAAFRRLELDADGLVVDIGRASEQLKEVLASFNYRNLDDLPAHFRDGDMQPAAETLIGERAAERMLSHGPMPLMSYKNRPAARLLRLQSVADPATSLPGIAL